MSLAQPLLQLRGATAALERQRSLKRCRHLLNAWSSQRLETLERCIATLLEQSSVAPGPPEELPRAPVGPALNAGLDMEARIDAMFADLNSDALRFQELYYNERKHISHLDNQRRASFEEVAGQGVA
jgi:DNA primase